jgi:predicted DCC family thiol-disulfide oxidoreductase YuxK
MTVHLVYDGSCLFCMRSLRVVRALDLRHVLQFHDANERSLVIERFPELATVDLDAAMYAVDERGRVYAGFYAFRRVAWQMPPAWWLLPILYLPGVGAVGAWAYGLIAENRSSFGCRVDRADPGA